MDREASTATHISPVPHISDKPSKDRAAQYVKRFAIIIRHLLKSSPVAAPERETLRAYGAE